MDEIETVYRALSIANIIFGIVLFVTSYIYYRQYGSWVKIAYGFIGLYWTTIYILVAFAPEAWWHTDEFARSLVRSGITATLAIMAVGGIARIKWNGA